MQYSSLRLPFAHLSTSPLFAFIHWIRSSTMAWRRGFVDRSDGDSKGPTSTNSPHFISEKGGNDAPATYQDASGAPVENDSPLGYSVGPITITLLNITMMIGAGIYSTRMLQLPADQSLVTYTKQPLPSWAPQGPWEFHSCTGHLDIWYVLMSEHATTRNKN